MRFLLQSFLSRRFLFPLRYIFHFFFSSLLVWWCQFPLFLDTSNFLSLEAFLFFYDLLVLSLRLFFLFFFSFFYMNMAHFSTPNSIPVSWLYILVVASGSPVFFLFSCKCIYIIHAHKDINLFLWLSKFVTPGIFPKLSGASFF